VRNDKRDRGHDAAQQADLRKAAVSEDHRAAR
jgi:hypothetical protein